MYVCVRQKIPARADIRLVLTSSRLHALCLTLSHIHCPRIKMSITKDRKSNDRRTIDVDERDWSWFINGPPPPRAPHPTTSLFSYCVRVTTQQFFPREGDTMTTFFLLIYINISSNQQEFFIFFLIRFFYFLLIFVCIYTYIYIFNARNSYAQVYIKS